MCETEGRHCCCVRIENQGFDVWDASVESSTLLPESPLRGSIRASRVPSPESQGIGPLSISAVTAEIPSTDCVIFGAFLLMEFSPNRRDALARLIELQLTEVFSL